MTAYQAGRISRRTFIRGMAALGLSVSVATALAESIEAAPAGGGNRGQARAVGMPDEPRDDTYGEAPHRHRHHETGTGAVTTLPETGIGQSQSSGSGLLKTGMVAGAAALIAGGYRKLKGAAAEDEAK
jgi:hypothetical protein